MTLEFSWQIFEKYFNNKFQEICPVGAKLFHVDGQMDSHVAMTKLIVTFHNFANLPKNY
jgi:hypothetical protein